MSDITTRVSVIGEAIYPHLNKPDVRFNENGEYEIWYYDNKEFIFINKFGIYQLHKQYK